MGFLAALAPFAAGLGSIGSSLIGGAMGASGQREANRANAAEAQRNRDFQERMSNSAVTRRMADMKKGGINPLLAGKFDASTPAGNMATMGNPNAHMAANLGGAGAEAVSSALAVKKQKKELELMDAQIEGAWEQYGLTHDQRGVAKMMESKGIQEILNLKTAREVAKVNLEFRNLEIPGMNAEADFWKWMQGAGMSEISKAAGKAGPILAPLLRIFVMMGKIKR